jgi:hypothetical protein
MFLIDYAPRVASQARLLGSQLRSAAPVVYEVLLQPVPENQAVFRAMSDLVGRLKYRSSTERRLMLDYTASLLLGDGSLPQGMDWSLASFTKHQVDAQCYAYHRKHRLRPRSKAAA